MVSKKQKQIAFRREQIFTLLSRGMTQRAIANQMGLDTVLVSRDVAAIKENIKQQISTYYEDILMVEVFQSIRCLDLCLSNAVEISENADNNKDRLSAINAIVGIIASRIDLITAREVLNQNVSAITEAAQQQRGNHDIEVSNQQPQKFGDVNPDFVGAAS